MLFTSLAFALFFPLVFLIYWFVTGKNHRVQNGLLLAASYLFYGWWNWKFLILLASVSVINYLLVLQMGKRNTKQSRKPVFICALVLNIALLVATKYLLFFLDIVISLFTGIGIPLKAPEYTIIVPLGVSFYTFLALSYILDVYHGRMKAGTNIVEVLLSFSFFPIILAGPIQRPVSLLPQIRTKREFDYALATEGMKRILLGLFMKLVIADQCAGFVDQIFNNPDAWSASTLIVGVVYYAIQIYADFAGYSEIAIGTAAMLGFKLMRNFNFPYFSTDIADFWKRWHISLTMWFRDYVFLPVAYAVSGKIKQQRVGPFSSDMVIYIIAIAVTWLLTGLWHGASMAFIVWGLIHGTALVISKALNNPRKQLLRRLNLRHDNFFVVTIRRAYMLFFVLLAWLFFRAGTMELAITYLKRIIWFKSFRPVQVITPESILIIALFFLAEWLQRNRSYTLDTDAWKIPMVARWAIYYALFVSLFLFSQKGQAFIYMQF